MSAHAKIIGIQGTMSAIEIMSPEKLIEAAPSSDLGRPYAVQMARSSSKPGARGSRGSERVHTALALVMPVHREQDNERQNGER
jgi:hypothetical protein